MAATKTKFELKREASHAALVDSAMRRFAQHGFAATRVEDIVADTPYTKGAFYFHFENKLDCFWAVVEHREELRGDWVAHVMDGADAASLDLEQMLARTFAHFAEVEQGVSAWVLVMVDFLQQHRHDAEVHAKLAEIYAGWHRNIVRFLEALQAGGWIAADRDAGLLATQTFAFVEGLTVHARLYGIPAETLQAALIDGLVRLFTASAD